MFPVFVCLILLVNLPSHAQLPLDREIEAEKYLNSLYRYFGPPGSRDFEEALGHQNATNIYRGIIEGVYSTQDAERIVRDILKERRRLIPDFYLPSQDERFSSTIQRTDDRFLAEPTPPSHRVYRRQNPLIGAPSSSNRQESGLDRPPENNSRVVSPIPPPARRVDSPSRETSPTADPTSTPPPPRTYTLEDLQRRLGQVGIQTSGGARGQYPSLLYSTEVLIDDLRSLINAGGRIESSTRPRPAIALIQLLLIAGGEDLGEDGVDGVNQQGKVNLGLRRFQQRSGQPPTGNLDPETLQALLKALMMPIRS